MMELQNGQAIAAQDEPESATGRNAAVDELTTAIMTGASPAEIERLEGPAGTQASQDGPHDGANDGQDGMPGDEPGQPANEIPPDARNAERIRLTGLQERDKGLVNAANIVARTEGISFDDAWRRVNGNGSGTMAAHDTQAEAGQWWQPESPATAPDAERESQLHLARELYGDLNDPGSALWQEAHRIATDPSHPDHTAAMAANTPLTIAKLAAANLGMRGGAAQPVLIARPAAATKQSAPPAPQKTARDIVRESAASALDAVEGRTGRPLAGPERAYLRL